MSTSASPRSPATPASARRLEQERERAVAALAAANDELESLNRRLEQAAEDQSQFLAVTAHELRTPIGVLGGSAETLARHWEQLTDDERDELLERHERRAPPGCAGCSRTC